MPEAVSLPTIEETSLAAMTLEDWEAIPSEAKEENDESLLHWCLDLLTLCQAATKKMGCA